MVKIIKEYIKLDKFLVFVNVRFLCMVIFYVNIIFDI